MIKDGTKRRGETLNFFWILVMVNVIFTVVYFVLNPNWFGPQLRFRFIDFTARWREGRYFLKHINPNLVVLGEVPELAEIGNPGYEMTTFPVSYILGQLIVPAFLPYWAAFGWMVSVLILTTIRAWKVLLKYLPVHNWLKVCLFLTVAGWNIEGLSYGNYGMIMCNLVIIAMDLVDRKPWAAGFLLATASCKPQLTMMFFFALLFAKKWKPMLIGGFTTVGTLLFASVWLQTSPLAFFSQMARIGERFLLPFRYAHTLGVANNLMYYTDSSGLTQLVSAVICVAVMAWVEVFFYRKGVQDNIVLQWSLAAVLSSVCAYKYFHDLYVITVFLVLAYAASQRKERIWLLMMLFANRLFLLMGEVVIRTVVGEKNYWIQLPTVLAMGSVWLLCRIVDRYETQLRQKLPPMAPEE